MRYVAIALAILAGQAAFADGDAAAGEKVFKKCKACHSVGEKAKNKTGPILNGIVGAEAGSIEGYRYSKAFLAKKEEGLVWTEENLAAYLTKPKDFIPKTKMSFPGLKKEEDIANVIAYLEQYTGS